MTSSAAATAASVKRSTPCSRRSRCRVPRRPTTSSSPLLKRLRLARGQYIDEPVEVLPKAWRAWASDAQGHVHRVRLELVLWFLARDALRAGQLYRPIGRRYADPASFLMSQERWVADREEIQRP